MSVAKKMALRMGIYLVMVTYLACDLFVFSGPVYRSLNEPMKDQEAELAEARAAGVVARVFYRPIFKTQIEEAVKEYLWRRGRDLTDTSEAERRMLRELVLEQLIDDELLKLQIKVTESKVYRVDDEVVKKAVDEESGRYPNQKVFEELARTGGWQGLEEQELRVTARIQREDYLHSAVKDEVTEEEVKSWFEEYREDFGEAGFEEVKDSIFDVLQMQKRDANWRWFRRDRLRYGAKGKIDIYEEILFAEES